MPRDGSNVYSLPAGTAAVSGQTANSTHVNSRFSDLETDMNTDRPVAAGGTGASTASGARTNLEVLLREGTAYSGDLDDLTETGVYPLTTGASNHWTTAGAGDWVFAFYTDANTGFQLGFDADGTMFRRVEISGTWSTWAPYLNQNQVIGNDTDDLAASQALKLVAYGVVSSVSSGSFTVEYDEGCTATYDSTGTVAVAFDNARAAATYIVQATSEGDDDFVIVRNKTTSGFDIVGKDLSTGTTVDFGGVTFMVYEKRS